jgi:hypothetical protein
VGGDVGNAGVDGGFVVGGGLNANEILDEIEQGWLLATGSGEQGAHGNGRLRDSGHA